MTSFSTLEDFRSRIVAHSRRNSVHLWVLAGAWVPRFLVLVNGLVLVQILGASGYGKYAYFLVSTQGIGVLVGQGWATWITQRLAAARTEASRSFALSALYVSSAIWLIIVAVVGGALLLYITTRFRSGNAPIDASEIIYGVCLMVTSLAAGILNGLSLYMRASILTIAFGIGQIVCAITGALIEHARGAVLGLEICGVVFVILAIGALPNVYRPHRVLKATAIEGIAAHLRGESRNLTSVLINSCMVAPVLWFTLSLMRDNTLEVAIINIGQQWRTVVTAIATGLSIANMTSLARKRYSDVLGYKRLVVKSVLLTLVASLIAAASVLGVLGAAPRLYHGLIIQHWSSFMLLVASGIAAATSAAIGDVLVSAGHFVLSLVLNAVWATIFVSLVLLFSIRNAYFYGIAMLTGYCVHMIISAIATSYILKRTSYLKPA